MDPSTRGAPDAVSHLAIRLRGAVSDLNRQLRAGAAEPGLGSAALTALSQLYRRGALTPTQLAQHERVRLQSLTRLLAELEAAGLLKRRPHPEDRRQTLLALTAAGARALTAEARRREASLATVLAERLAADERRTLLQACALLERVADGLVGNAPAEPGAPMPRKPAAPTAGRAGPR